MVQYPWAMCFRPCRCTVLSAALRQTETVLFDPPAVLVSQWTAEFDADRRAHPAIVQLMAPGGEQVLWTKRMELDFRYQSFNLMMLIMQDLQFVGEGNV